MEKISLSQIAKDGFFNQIMNQFYDSKNKTKRFKKKNKKKEIFNIDLKELNKLILKKLKGFDENICLEKLILLNHDSIKDLCGYIDKNKYITNLADTEKDYFYTLYSRLNNAQFISDLDISVCPYCNRNYIFNFTKNNSKEATAQLDHFYDKKTYPYLAVSIYNLVPSCSTCNQRKSTKDQEIFYPYEESFNQHAKFVYDGIKTDLKNQKLDFFDEKRISLKIEVINEKSKVKNHREVFNIDNLYENHKDIVKELLQKRVIYSDSYIEELFSQYSEKIFSSREELIRLLSCGYVSDEDINKRPMSKLIKDISEDLGIK